MDPNEALSNLGNPWKNPWQMIMYNLIISYMGIISSWQMMAIVFVGGEPKHRCRLPDSLSINESIPYSYTDGERHFDSCVVYENYSSATNRTIPCPLGWVYEYDSFTITEQWNLVCDKNYWTETTQTVLVLGVLFGAITMTRFADTFGRKRTFLLNECAGTAVLFLAALVDSYYLFTGLRFLLGIFIQGAGSSGYVLACELFPAKHRTTAGVLGWIYWPVGMVTLAGISFFIRNWRHLLIATSLPGLFVVPLFWIIPESIPWLNAKNRVDEAKQILHTAAKMNNIELPKMYRQEKKDSISLTYIQINVRNQTTTLIENAESALRTTKTVSQEYTFIDIITSRTLRLNAAALFYLWFVVCFVYYGLSLSSGALVGNKYVNFGLSGAVEIPAVLLCIPLFNRIGRRWPLCILLIISGFSLLVTSILPQTSGAEMQIISVAFSMIGKFCISAAFTGVFLITPELYPTTVRSVGLGLGSAGGRFGNMLAPYSTYFARLAPWLPGLLFGTLSVIGGGITLLLPETSGRPLPQTIEELENIVDTDSQRNAK